MTPYMTPFKRIGPLFTDLYELTMAAGYHRNGIFGPATFSLFIRDHHRQRAFYLAAGLEDVLRELAGFHFSPQEIGYLRETGLFGADFIDYLRHLRFSGDVYAMPEGTVFFPEEPLVEIDAPIMEAQLLETYLLNTIGFQTLIASKAARCMYAARGKALIDFSLRRAQGQDAGLKVARSSYMAGFVGTSNVLAGKLYKIPISGTMAHSFVTAFDSELAAFEAYAEAFPGSCVLLIDTYDTLQGARNAVKVGRRLAQKGHLLKGVRLDSGDMVALSREVRRMLDAGGLPDVKIFASSGFDEFSIHQVLEEGACIDAFGVGTKMGVSADAPYLDIVYKMVHFNGHGVRKLSPGKTTQAGRKQVYRRLDDRGRYLEDTLALREERFPGMRPLMEKVMQSGRILQSFPPINDLRRRTAANLDALDPVYRSPSVHAGYPVHRSRRLLEIQG